MKTLNDKDRSLLIKILNLTQSNQDGEAMNAIRAANRLLKSNGLQWEDLIGSMAPVVRSQHPSYDFSDLLRRAQEAKNRATQNNQPFGFSFNGTQSTGGIW